MRKKRQFNSVLPVVLLLAVVTMLTNCKDSQQEKTYEPTWESLSTHQVPKWFRDAKFGVWTVWGPHAVPAYESEWYGHHMYRKGSDVYDYHSEHYGDPSEFGYKDFFPMWKAKQFNPEKWAELYEKAGAKFAGLMAIYHDGLAKWDTDLTEWNTVDKGPNIDIVAEMEKPIRERDMKFILCFHHGASFNWFTEDLRGKKGTKDFDIWNPDYEELYHGSTDKVNDDFIQWWKSLMIDGIDQFRPDLIWHDFGLGDIPDSSKQEVLSYYYNSAEKWGKEVDFTHKLHRQGLSEDVGIDDYERDWNRDSNQLYERPWQTDLAVMTNSWGYIQNPKYKSINRLIFGIVDRTSKNGNTMLAIAPKANGVIPEEQRKQLLGIGKWLDVNGEAIYGTRPWTTAQEGEFLRFTRKGSVLYAISLEWPGKKFTIKSLNQLDPDKIESIIMLGDGDELEWNMTEEGLVIEPPRQKPCKYAYSFKIAYKEEFEGY